MDLLTFTTRAIKLYEQVRMLDAPLKFGWDEELDANDVPRKHLVLGTKGKKITPEDVSKFLHNYGVDDDILPVAVVGTQKDREKRIKKAKKEVRKMRKENDSEESEDIWQANGAKDEKDYYNQIAYDYSDDDEHFIIITKHL